MANTARRKGHDFERLVAKRLRDVFPLAATSRQESRALDEAEVDIANVPIYIQCKSGYEKARPKYELILSRMEEKLAGRPVYPKWVLHKLNGKTKTLAVTTSEEFYEIVYTIHQHKTLVNEIKEYIINNDNSTSTILKDMYDRLLSKE
jgi:hypothetical protein